MTDKLEEIQILFQKRNVRKRGPTSSDQQNDTIDEIAHDLAAFNDQWNKRLVTLTSAIPSGALDSTVDGWKNGLDGGNLFVDQNATSSVNSTYFNNASTRPNTFLDQFGLIYSEIDSVRDDLENQINNTTLSAIKISVADTAGLFQSTNVEDSLSEVMTQVNALSLARTLLVYKATTAERDSLAPENGMLLYNETTNKFQGYENGAWANLI